MKHPNFFIVGAPKCGTSALSEYLRGHPCILVSHPKEPHFFADDFAAHRGVGTWDAYRALFAGAGPDHLAVGEASVFYLYSKAAIPRIREFHSGARLIAMLRNPVDLVHSMHAQLRWVLYEDEPDFETAWNLQEARRRGERIPPTCPQPEFLQYAALGSLGEQVERMVSIFPREQVHFIVFDDFAKDTARVYEEVLAFLGVPSDGRTEFPRVNENKQHKSLLLARLLRWRPRPLEAAIRSARRTLGVESFGRVRYRIKMANRTVTPRAPLSPELRREIGEAFRPDVERLSGVVGRDLTGWLAPREARSPESA